MISSDALVALFAFGGVYAAAAFGWGTIQIGIFGVLLTITGALGALVGGRLDDRFGPGAVIAASLVTLIIACVAIMGTSRTTVAFLLPVDPPQAGGALFNGTAERAYIVFGLFIGLVAGPLQAASRSNLVRLAPPDAIGQYFGLFALSGKVTSFVGPLLVAAGTQMTGRIEAGIAVLCVMFSLGLGVLLRSRAEVRQPPRAPRA
jgi:UMF1 family MFS transporter